MACPARMHTLDHMSLPELDLEAWIPDDPDPDVYREYRLISKCTTCGEVLYLNVDIFDDRLWSADTD